MLINCVYVFSLSSLMGDVDEDESTITRFRFLFLDTDWIRIFMVRKLDIT
jgi:hypothetical protein